MPLGNHHHFLRKFLVGQIISLVSVKMFIMFASESFTQAGLHIGERRMRRLMLLLQRLP